MHTDHNFIPLPLERLAPNEQLARSQQFRARMSTRRSVRDYSREPVPLALIENAIATAASAPSGANQQPWTFVVVADPTLKQRIRAAAEAEERESYERRMSDEWKAALAPLGTDWHKPHLEDAPYLIVVFQQVYGLEVDSDGQTHKIKHYYTTESVGIAVAMLLASLHLAGLATLTHTPNPMAFLSEILARPANERAFVIIPVGYPAEGARVPAISKKPLEQMMIIK
jgi:nitroreductase